MVFRKCPCPPTLTLKKGGTGATTITFEVVGEPSRLADFLEIMRTYGIVSLVKSGRIALAKDQKAGARKQQKTA